MKKTLIALAVLAASGASFAQATISGNYTFGYKQVSGGGAAQTSGIGTDTSDINFAASEDLGGGLKASAKMGISNANRLAGVVGNTASVSIGSSAFTVTAGSIESTNGLLAIGSSGASGFGLDGSVISGSSTIDVVALAVPLSSAFTLGASYVDRSNGTLGSALGEGSTGPATAQPSWTLGVTYAAGPLAAKLDATNWGRQLDSDVVITSGIYNKNRYRLSAGYDFGVARLSAGYSNLNVVTATTSGTDTETLIGVKVPVGALTFGLDYGQRTTTNFQDANGYSLGVQYDLSKRTNVSTSYAAYKKGASALTTAAPQETTNAFRLYLSHSF